MILTTQLIREIGLKSFILEGLLIFGTNVMKDVFIDCRSIFSFKEIKAKLIDVFFNYVPILFEK
jgi:hypothetical protein